MTMAGKKLQTIYDSGTKELARIEDEADKNLDKIVKQSGTRRQAESSTDSEKVEEKAKDLEADLTVSMERASTRLEEIKTEQLEKCRTHSQKLQEELNGVGDTIKTSLQQLLSAMKDQLQDVQQELSYDYDTAFEQSVVALEKQSFESNKSIRTHGQALTNGLQQKLDQNLWETKGSEKQIVSQLFKDYMTKANSIETHFSSLMQKLSEEFRDQYEKLNDTTSNADSSVSEATATALKKFDNVTSELEQEINRFFGDTITKCTRELDSGLGDIAQEISSTHSSATSSLTQKTQDYGTSLQSTASGVQEKLTTSFQDLTTRADALHTQFLDRMEKKVEESKMVRADLEETKRGSINKIKDELVEIRREFQEQLQDLAEEAESKVQLITFEVEKDVRAAHTRCLNKLEEDGQSARDEIDGQVKNLLDLIAKHKQSALNEIAKAAGIDTSQKS